MAEQVSLFVPGIPAPQGSKQGFVVKTVQWCKCSGRNPRCQVCWGTGRRFAVALKESSARVKGWRELVFLHMRRFKGQLEGPVRLVAVCAFGWPKSYTAADRRDQPWPTNHAIGDWDKLSRALCDSVAEAECIADDAWIVGGNVEKAWTVAQPGAYLHLVRASYRPVTTGELLESFGMQQRCGTVARQPGRPAHELKPLAPVLLSAEVVFGQTALRLEEDQDAEGNADAAS